MAHYESAALFNLSGKRCYQPHTRGAAARRRAGQQRHGKPHRHNLAERSVGRMVGCFVRWLGDDRGDGLRGTILSGRFHRRGVLCVEQ